MVEYMGVPMKASKDEEYLTALQVAARYKFLSEGLPNPALARRAAQRGGIPRPLKFNHKKVLWRASELDAWEASLPRQVLQAPTPGKHGSGKQGSGRRRGRPTKSEQIARMREGLYQGQEPTNGF